jgi:hypothetical protein
VCDFIIDVFVGVLHSPILTPINGYHRSTLPSLLICYFGPAQIGKLVYWPKRGLNRNGVLVGDRGVYPAHGLALPGRAGPGGGSGKEREEDMGPRA